MALATLGGGLDVDGRSALVLATRRRGQVVHRHRREAEPGGQAGVEGGELQLLLEQHYKDRVEQCDPAEHEQGAQVTASRLVVRYFAVRAKRILGVRE